MTANWLVLDIGNTHTVAGLYRIDASRAQDHEHALLARVRFRTDPQATADEYRTQLTQLFQNAPLAPAAGPAASLPRIGAGELWTQLGRVIVASVVPSLEAAVRSACGKIPALFIGSETRREFELDLPFPDQLGADRLANVAGAFALAEPPFLIVDAGTATTFCLVDERPAYIGGAIVPGLETGWKALQSRAAKLFSVELDRPATSIGRTTETQLQSGVLLGYEALIEGLADRLLEDARKAGALFNSPVFFATGGCVQPLRLSSRFRVEPDLTLQGLIRYGFLTL